MSLTRKQCFIVMTLIFIVVVIVLFFLNFPTSRWITGRSRTRLTQFTALKDFILEPDFTKTIAEIVFVNCSLIIKEGKVLNEIKEKKMELPVLIVPTIIKGQHQNIKILDLSKEQNPPSLNFSEENNPDIELLWEEGKAPNLSKLSIKLLHPKTQGSLSLYGNNLKKIDIPTNSKVFENASGQIKRYKKGEKLLAKSRELFSETHYLEGDIEIEFYSQENGEIKIDSVSPSEAKKDVKQTTPLIRKILPSDKPGGSFKGIAFKPSRDTVIDLGGQQGEKEYKAGQDIAIRSNNFHIELFIDNEGMQLSFAGESKDVRANNVQQIQGRITDLFERNKFWMVISVLAAVYFSLWSMLATSLFPSPPKSANSSGSNDKSFPKSSE